MSVVMSINQRFDVSQLWFMDKEANGIGKMEVVSIPSTLTALGSVSFDLKLGSFISLGVAGSFKVSNKYSSNRLGVKPQLLLQSLTPPPNLPRAQD